MVKEEPTFNIWEEIPDSELVLEVAKVVRAKIRKTTRKTSPRLARDFPRNFAGN